MKMRMGRWLLGLAMLFVFAGVYTPPQAEAAVGVVVVVHMHITGITGITVTGIIAGSVSAEA